MTCSSLLRRIFVRTHDDFAIQAHNDDVTGSHRDEPLANATGTRSFLCSTHRIFLLAGLRNSATLPLQASSFFHDLKNPDLTAKNSSPVLEDRGHFFAAGIESFCWPEEPSHSASSGVKLFSRPEEFGSHYEEPLASARRTRLFLYFRHRVFLLT